MGLADDASDVVAGDLMACPAVEIAQDSDGEHLVVRASAPGYALAGRLIVGLDRERGAFHAIRMDVHPDLQECGIGGRMDRVALAYARGHGKPYASGAYLSRRARAIWERRAREGRAVVRGGRGTPYFELLRGRR